MAMSKYETIMWEKEMKEQILSHARILYAEKLTPTSVLDVISTQASDLYTSVSYSSCFMMIDTPQNTTYRILLRTKGKDSVGDSLEALLRELRLKLTPHVVWSFNGLNNTGLGGRNDSDDDGIASDTGALGSETDEGGVIGWEDITSSMASFNRTDLTVTAS